MTPEEQNEMAVLRVLLDDLLESTEHVQPYTKEFRKLVNDLIHKDEAARRVMVQSFVFHRGEAVKRFGGYDPTA